MGQPTLLGFGGSFLRRATSGELNSSGPEGFGLQGFPKFARDGIPGVCAPFFRAIGGDISAKGDPVRLQFLWSLYCPRVAAADLLVLGAPQVIYLRWPPGGDPG